MPLPFPLVSCVASQELWNPRETANRGKGDQGQGLLRLDLRRVRALVGEPSSNGTV